MAVNLGRNFPPELLTSIFGHLDGKSLAKCGSVCARWNAVVKDMNQFPNLWKDICSAEIPMFELSEMVETMYTRDASSLSWSEWKCIYVHWCVWEKRYPVPIEIKRVCQDDTESVRCFVVSGKICVTASSDGNLALWDIDRGTWPIRVCNVALEQLYDIALFRLGYQEKFPGMEHDLIVTTSKTRWLIISRPLREGIHTVFGTALDASYGLFHKVSSNGRDKGVVLSTRACNLPYVRVFKLSIVEGELFPAVEMIYTVNQLCAAPVGIYLSTFSNTFTVLHHHQGLTVRTFDSPVVIESATGIASITAFSAAQSFRKNLVVCVPNDKYLGPSTTHGTCTLCLTVRVHNSPLSCFFHKPWLGNATCFMLYGSLFAVGTLVGEVFVYNIKPNQCLEQLDLCKFTWKVQGTSGLPVTGLQMFHSPTEQRLFVSSLGSINYFILAPGYKKEWWDPDNTKEEPVCEDIPQDIAVDLAIEISVEVPEGAPEGAADDIAASIAEDIAEDFADNILDDFLDAIAEDISE